MITFNKPYRMWPKLHPFDDTYHTDKAKNPQGLLPLGERDKVPKTVSVYLRKT